MYPLSVLFFFFIYFFSFINLLLACVAPVMDCPNENVTFWLYTKANKDSPHQIRVNDSNSINSAPWVKEAPLKVLIHGYTGHKDFSPNTEIRPGTVTVNSITCITYRNKPTLFHVRLDRRVYLEHYDYNIISVDYNPIAREPCYFEAARNTELVGKCLAQLIDELVKENQYNLSLFHIIGFSLGAHAAGYVSNFLTSGKLERISALDPALPLFVTSDRNKKIDADDAKQVDVLHTNCLQKGKLETCGHTDFYANGGMEQPGCQASKELTKSGCNHARAPQYFAESINTKVGFYGTKCYSWIMYMIGWCELVGSNNEILYGEHISKNVTGMYFFSTNSKAPYARGKSKKQTL